MSHLSLLTVTVVFLLYSFNKAAGDVYQITTSSVDTCSGTCITLYQFATNNSHYLNSNTTLVFLPATHYLVTDLIVTNQYHFEMYSENSTARIACASYAHIHFDHSQYIHITNLEFIGCGGNQVANVDAFLVQDATFIGERYSGTTWEIIETRAHIVNSTFVSNRIGMVRTFILVDTYTNKASSVTNFVGGTIVATYSNITMSQSTFENNVAVYGGVIFAEQNSIINISNSSFINNTATNQGGVLHSSNSTTTIEISTFDGNTASYYGGMLYSSFTSTIMIVASNFHNSTATYGGVLYSHKSIITTLASKYDGNTANFAGGVLYTDSSSIIIEGSDFGNNNGFFGGTMYSSNSTLTIKTSKFDHSVAASTGGVLYSLFRSNISIEESTFRNNIAANRGGMLYSLSFSTITIEGSAFDNNSVSYDGGVLYSTNGNISIGTSRFVKNTAFVGGALASVGSGYMTIKATDFRDNSASFHGGVLYSSYNSIIAIETSVFEGNTATNNGGVIYLSFSSSIKIAACKFENNSANSKGGVLYSKRSTITILVEESEFSNGSDINHKGVTNCSVHAITRGSSSFTNNNSTIGAVIYVEDRSSVNQYNSVIVANNSVKGYAVIYLGDSKLNVDYSGNAMFFNNSGSLVAFNSNITFLGCLYFFGNSMPPQTGSLQEGGAITLFQSNAFFEGSCSLQNNHADNGGAMHSSESKIYVNGDVTIAHNTATGNGGGVYLSNSELNCKWRSNFILNANNATNKGGGIYVVSSSIKAISAIIQSYPYPQYPYSGARLIFTNNKAEKGGGLSLEANAKLYILKYTVHRYYEYTMLDTNTTIFIANTADYGGAVYVNDDTNSGTCAEIQKTECFFQVLAIHGAEDKFLNAQSMYFAQNMAIISGSTLYGGLLDRCAVSQFAEVRYKNREDIGNGVNYFNNVSIPTYNGYITKDDRGYRTGEVAVTTNISISSGPVNVCLCISNEHNCSYQREIEVKKGEIFTVSLVAVDQIGQSVSGIIQSSLTFTESGLAEGQLSRKIPAECTDLTFNVFSPHNFEYLSLYASDSPCKDAELSKRTIEINFLPCSCPIGLQISGFNKTNCTCDCHSGISQYVEQCDSHTGSFITKSQSRAWISYIKDVNHTGYLVYPNCPFDYCNSYPVSIDLNQVNGADAQCAYNRLSLLCGSCQPELSLSLDGSRCLSCPNHWPALLMLITAGALLAGIALVALLLMLNMTVAVGTLNGLIFYANIVYANKSILLPFQERNFITVFISLLNLELGIDTCFLPGMDTYVRTWLQLAFPAYVILLVIVVIIISSHSFRFSNLIGKKNPVATLATLILLSYAKLLEICFKSLSVGILQYPDGSSEMLWLPDATVKYLSGKHIPLFLVAVFILLIGLVYTALLFSWQWLLHLPRWRIFKFSRDHKLQAFMETYHTPYTPKHRYWTGLLLIVRATLYLVAAVNVSNNPQVALTAIIFAMSCILLLRAFTESRVYRKSTVNLLETFFFLNIIFSCIFTWYSLSNRDINQEAAAFTSVAITFIVMLFIIFYHVYTYTTALSVIKKKYFQQINGFFINLKSNLNSKSRCYQSERQLSNNDINDVIARPINTNDSGVLAELTYSVVELHQPYLAPPDPEVMSKHNIPEFLETDQTGVDKGGQDENVEGESKCYTDQKVLSA